MMSNMEQLIAEIKKIVPVKDTAASGDVVLIVAHDPEMVVYALLTGLRRDETRKDEWWHVDMFLLTVPPQPMTWTLRMEQLTGKEVFTMEGKKRFVVPVKVSGFKIDDSGGTAKEKTGKSGLRVVK